MRYYRYFTIYLPQCSRSMWALVMQTSPNSELGQVESRVTQQLFVIFIFCHYISLCACLHVRACYVDKSLYVSGCSYILHFCLIEQHPISAVYIYLNHIIAHTSCY